MMLFVSYEEEQRKEGTNTNVGVVCRVKSDESGVCERVRRIGRLAPYYAELHTLAKRFFCASL